MISDSRWATFDVGEEKRSDFLTIHKTQALSTSFKWRD